MNTPYATPFSPAPNSSNYVHTPMPTGYPQFPMQQQQQLTPQPYPFMMMPAHMQQPQQQMHQQQLQPQHQMPMQHHPGGFPMYYPTHNFPPSQFRHPFYHVNQFPVAPSPQTVMQPGYYASPGTPRAGQISARTPIHNASLNASLLSGSTSFNASFNDSVRYNPLGRGRARDHSLMCDQPSTSSSDRSFQQSLLDPREIANNNDLINYCITELCRKQLTEEELVVKVSKSRRFKKFGVNNLPAAISIVLNTFPCFASRTVIMKTSPNDVQPVLKTLWMSDKRYQKSRGSRLNATMFEIPEPQAGGGGEMLSVLGDIASLNLDEKKPPTTVAPVEKIVE